MLHVCRQLVSWDVWLIPLTSVTLIFVIFISKFFLNFYYKNTSNDKLKEEELSQVTVAFIGWATHVLQWKLQKVTSIKDILLIFKNFRGSDYKLQLAYMKLESLVIANQNVAVNMYLGLVHTARHMQRVSFAWKFSFSFFK